MSNIILYSSLLLVYKVLRSDLSMFATGDMLQTLPLSCDRAHEYIGNHFNIQNILKDCAFIKAWREKMNRRPHEADE